MGEMSPLHKCCALLSQGFSILLRSLQHAIYHLSIMAGVISPSHVERCVRDFARG